MKCKFFNDLKFYFWEELELFYLGVDQNLCGRVVEGDQFYTLTMCHSSTCGGHFSTKKAATKNLQC